VVVVDFRLVQDGGGVDHALRMIQFDLTMTDGAFGLPPVDFWDFSSVPACIVDPADCGIDHYIDGDRTDVRPWGNNALVIAFGSADELGENLNKQLVLPGSGEVTVAQLTVNVPVAAGNYMLDVVNTNETDVDMGAQVRWGFGMNINSENLTAWRASGASPDLTGGELEFCVGPACCPVVVSSSPPCDSMLSRTQGNCLFIDFNGPITDPVSGEVEVRELLDGGALGADVTADFTFTASGSTLKVDNTGAPLANQTWYAVRGIDGCFDFDLQYGVVYGDANGDTRTNAFDLNDIWRNRADPAPECSPNDINADGRVNAFDLSAAWLNRNSEDPGKPSGHSCDPAP
jgi:hypothetical protein